VIILTDVAKIPLVAVIFLHKITIGPTSGKARYLSESEARWNIEYSTGKDIYVERAIE